MIKVKEHIEHLIKEAAAGMGLADADIAFDLIETVKPEFGDFTTNFAMIAAKSLGRPPREIATEMREVISSLVSRYVERVDVAGPGFVNFYLNSQWLFEEIRLAVSLGTAAYAKVDVGKRSSLLLEFVSANPTGPLHVGNGWWASYGDALGRLLRFVGYEVSTEYYVNDTGGQIRQLGESMLAVIEGREIPEGGYQGEYVKSLAREYQGELDVTSAGKFAADRVIKMIRLSLEELGIEFDSWYSQASIEESGAVDKVIKVLGDAGAIEDREGQKLFLSTRWGDSRDRFLTKANGDFTYLAGDIAYHYNKLVTRGFDHLIDIFGADHQGQVASLFAGVQAFGCDPSRLEILLGQMVSLQKGDERVKFSKRKGNVVDLSELVEEIGASAVRLLSLQSSIDRATVVDLEKVTSKSMDNPVYYIQYAHARMAAIERMRLERSIAEPKLATTDLSVLVHPRELELLRIQSRLDEVISIAAIERAPYKLVTWLKDFAGAFHGFYHDCSILGDGPELTSARLLLVHSARVALQIALGIIGVHAPEQM